MADKFQRTPIPEIHEYWDEPDTKDFGYKSEDTLFISIGHALTVWEQIENMLSMMFALFVESGSDAARRAYGAISSASGRREALGMAAQVFAGNQVSDFPMRDFQLLMNHVGKASGRRNEIAHGIVTSFSLDGNEHGFFLVPADYNSRKTAARTIEWRKNLSAQTSTDQFAIFGSLYRYTSSDINHFRHLFKKLFQQVGGFYMEQMVLYGQRKFDNAPDNQKSSLQLGEPQKDQPDPTQ